MGLERIGLLSHKRLVSLRRCGKSCRLRWLNYLRPNIKHGEFSDDEDRIICTLFSSIGSRWSIIAAQLPGRTDNDIKNYWNTKLKKKLMGLMLPSSPSSSCQKIRPQYQATTTYPSISSLLQTPPPISTSSLSYKFTTNSAYSSSTTTRSFITGYDHDQDNDQTITSIPYSSLLNPTTQNAYVGPMHNYLMFGGIDQAASCSSSDGSCNNNQISHAKEVDQYDQFNYIYNGVNEIQNPKSMLPNGGDLDGLYGQNPLDYGLEEIKQLISCRKKERDGGREGGWVGGKSRVLLMLIVEGTITKIERVMGFASHLQDFVEINVEKGCLDKGSTRMSFLVERRAEGQK
ncbi:hypothetical protein RJ639_002632, partial [Escallonia herrerae]